MHHIFIYPSIIGYLGCFYGLAIVNSAAMNIGVHVYFQAMFFFLLLFFLHICPGVELQGHMIALIFLFFKEPPYCSP